MLYKLLGHFLTDLDLYVPRFSLQSDDMARECVHTEMETRFVQKQSHSIVLIVMSTRLVNGLYLSVVDTDELLLSNEQPMAYPALFPRHPLLCFSCALCVIQPASLVHTVAVFNYRM